MSGMRARVIVASNRAWAGVYADSSGPILVQGLRQLGFDVDDPVVVPDGEPVGQALREAIADGVDAVVTSGGTGITPTDRTPDVTRSILDYEVPGIAEAIRPYSHRQPARVDRRRAGRAGRARSTPAARRRPAPRRRPLSRLGTGDRVGGMTSSATLAWPAARAAAYAAG